MMDATKQRRQFTAEQISELRRNPPHVLSEREVAWYLGISQRNARVLRRMSQAALEAAVFEMKTRPSTFRMLRRAADNDLTEKIRNHRALAAGNVPPHPNQSGPSSEATPPSAAFGAD